MKKPKSTNAKKSATKKAKAPAKPPKSVSRKMMLVYGYDEDAQPHAAGFGSPDFKLAKKAAGLLGFKILTAPAMTLNVAIKGIRSGNVYASGDGFAPKVSQKRFNELVSRLKLTPPVPPAPKQELPRPVSFDKIDVGQLVLGQHDDPTLGFWECLVEAIDGETLALRARDFPEIEVKRHRATVALLYTKDFEPVTRTNEAAPGLPVGWQDITPEHMVLASAGERAGWYPVIVTKREGDEITAYWESEPQAPHLTLSVFKTALMFPKAP